MRFAKVVKFHVTNTSWKCESQSVDVRYTGGIAYVNNHTEFRRGLFNELCCTDQVSEMN